MNLKQQILEEIEQLSEDNLTKVLADIYQLKAQQEETQNSQVWQAYLASKKEREEVYQKLADS